MTVYLGGSQPTAPLANADDSLEYELLALVVEGGGLGGDVVPSVVGHGLDTWARGMSVKSSLPLPVLTLVVSIAIVLSGRELPRTLVAGLELALNPSRFPLAI